MSTNCRSAVFFVFAAWLTTGAGATQVAALSFEQLTDASEIVAAGRIARFWTAWDPEHKYVWTHYELEVASVVKGRRAPLVEFAEPGGTVDGQAMVVAGSLRYAVGDNMLLFLARMPNGYLRTTGWTQGKYAIDSRGRLHASAPLEGDLVLTANSPVRESSLRSLDGMTLAELTERVATRLRAIQDRQQ